MELEQWISKVNIYVDVIVNQIKRDSIWWKYWCKDNDEHDGGSLLQDEPNPENANDDDYYKYRSKVSYIHTGSIPSQFGKPLMTLSELLPSIVR